MNEHEYFEVWWSKQELGNKEHYEKNRALRMVAWSGWLARSLLEAPAPATNNAQGAATRPLYEDMNAQRWAREFNKVFAELHEGCELDEGWLIGWFANAIMCGHDVALRRAALQMPASDSIGATDAIVQEFRGKSIHGLAIALADNARFLESDVAHWKRLYECAQNANAYRQDALEDAAEYIEQLRDDLHAAERELEAETKLATTTMQQRDQLERALHAAGDGDTWEAAYNRVMAELDRDQNATALFALARECGWSEFQSRPAELFIRDRLQSATVEHDLLRAITSKVTAYPSGSTTVNDGSDAGLSDFWQAIRDACLVGEKGASTDSTTAPKP